MSITGNVRYNGGKIVLITWSFNGLVEQVTELQISKLVKQPIQDNKFYLFHYFIPRFISNDLHNDSVVLM